MVTIFRKIRQSLLQQNRVTRYLVYAIGEIILVVIGILIALQVNNYREAQIKKARERAFLHGLKSDLLLNITELDRSIDRYTRASSSAEVMISYFEGAPISGSDSLNFHTMEVLNWEPFIRNNSTIREMISSGSLGILSDDSLKSELMRMELNYDKIDGSQEHMRYDYQEYLYGPYFRTGDVGQAYKDYIKFVDRDTQTSAKPTSPEVIEKLLSDPTYKNGFSLCLLNGRNLIEELKTMKVSTEQLLDRIEAQLNR
ncbi:hypothetical protein D0X99_00775 [Algoriphagus lacus]|uniref:Uncharacterized protein n=1 Tax=Algoriphagus lacus TaxID=2056311 RepID=A0A418PVT1_9BACT|nr:DUF6090 family protein [Algoriphagus lacus]RIW18264.1 hypothetical protein D0X99_00775 [Algoriphagus lacus]